jgi:glycosyl hydrolase family 18 (putative chitinase)
MLRHALTTLALAFALVGSTLASGVAPAAAATAPAPLTAGQLSHRMTAEVMGYLPYWELDDGTVAGLDYARLTTIAFFSVGMDAAGHLDRTAAGYTALMSDRATGVIEAAHAAGVRVIVCFTTFGAAKNAAFFSSGAAQATFVAEAAELVTSRGLDGADFDVELLSGTYFGAYAATAGALAAQMRTSNQIAFSSVATNANVSGAKMASQALAAGVDRAFLMGYNYRSAGAATVGSIDPLVHVNGGLSLSVTLDWYAAEGAPLNRVLLGLPLYGRTWQTVDASLHAARVSGVPGEVFFFRDLPELLAEGTVLADDSDPVESSARLVRQVGPSIYQTYYDTPASVAPKFGLVFSRGLAGIGFWALGYDAGNPAWWNLVGRTFGPPTVNSIKVAPSPTNTRAVTVSITWTDHDRPATEMRLANGTGNFSPWLPVAAETTWTLPASTVPAKRYVRVQLRDAADARSVIKRALVLFDPTKPKMTSLKLWWSANLKAWRIGYTASDTGSGVAAYRIRIQQNGVWTYVATARTAKTFTIKLPRTAHFKVAVNAVDRAGNVSTGAFRSR